MYRPMCTCISVQFINEILDRYSASKIILGNRMIMMILLATSEGNSPGNSFFPQCIASYVIF